MLLSKTLWNAGRQLSIPTMMRANNGMAAIGLSKGKKKKEKLFYFFSFF